MNQNCFTFKRLTYLCLVMLAQLAFGPAVADPVEQWVKPGPVTSALPHSGFFQGRGDGVHTCPVTGETVTQKSLKAEFFGRTVYFCCHGCLKAAQQNPEKFVKATLAEQHTAVKNVSAKIAQASDGGEYCND